MPRPAPRRGVGSGVVVTEDGYVLTNHHVVRDATKITVELSDGRTFDGRAIGTDEPSDLALVKIDATGLRAVPLGDSNAVEVGDVVLAVGNPLGLGQTVTMGIISAKGRSTARGDGSYEDFLQTDAPINQGNSGGALVNLRGELVGINSQILSPSGGNIGIGFAIPSNMARHVMDELRAEGRVRRAQLGVVVQQVTSEIARSLGLDQVGGAIVSEVAPGSAASKAGLEPQDVITTFNGQPVTDMNSLRNRVAEAKPGSAATLVVIRDGQTRTMTATLDEAAVSRQARADQSGDSADQAALGVTVAPITPAMRSRAGVPDDVNGLLVQEVAPDGRAASAGIQPGDVIKQVNRQPVRYVDDLRTAVRSAAADRPVLLLVNRDGRDLFVAVRPS
jgi:Do/DeqQ family serine protease